MPQHNLAIRLSVMDGGKAKAELKEIGESGEKSLRQIELAGKKSSKGLLALNAAANDLNGMAAGLASEIGPLGSALSAVGPAGLAAAAGIGALALILKKSFDEAALAEQAQNRLQGVLRATGYASGLTGNDIAAMAEEMENSTLTSAEAVKEAAAIMATFRSVSRDAFKQAIHLAQDMSAVFGQDLRSSATQLGKALEDPISGITALKRVGVSFTDSQKEVIAKLVETGEKAEAQKLILAALEQQVGGASKAETQGLTGAAHRMSVAWGDMLKAIGQTETVGGTAEAVLNKLASTFRTTIEWVSDAPLAVQLRDAKNELAEVEKELERIKDIPFVLQPRGNVDKHTKKAEELRKKIDEVTKALDAQAKEKKQAEEGVRAAQEEATMELIAGRNKGFQEIIAKSSAKDPSYQITELNKKLEETIKFYEKLRTAKNSAEIDKNIETAKQAASLQIADIQNPLAEAARKESATNQKIIDDLKKQLLGLTDERKAFIDQAVSRLSEKATGEQRKQAASLAGQLFDEKSFAEAQKVVDGLNDKMKELGLTARQLFIKDAVDSLSGIASPDRIAQVEKLAGVLFDEKEAQEKLDKLRDEGRTLTENAKTATEQYAAKIAHLNELLSAGAISQSVFNNALAGADADLLDSRTDPQAGILRAFSDYEEGATNAATAIQSAFSDAMKGTEDAIVNMVTSGKISLESLENAASSIVEDITRMLVKQNITTPLFGYLNDSAASGGWLSSLLSAFSFHEGGVVGEAAPRRRVPAYVFAGAQRYHAGGFPGLKPDEVPTILQKGEEVISRRDRQRRSSGVSMVMNISTPDANSFRASQGQIVSKAAKSLNRAKRNM